MTNPRAKGRRYEKKAERELQAEGWTTYLVPPSRMWQKNQDVFFLFDIFCCQAGKFRLIQIKTNQMCSLKKYREFYYDNMCENLSCEVWCYYQLGKSKTYKGWRKVII